MENKYKIIRYFLSWEKDHEGHLKIPTRTVKKDVPFEEAQGHCTNPKSRKDRDNDRYKGKYRHWFDTFQFQRD